MTAEIIDFAKAKARHRAKPVAVAGVFIAPMIGVSICISLQIAALRAWQQLLEQER